MSDDLERRLDALENWRNEVQADLKADAVRREWMDAKFKNLDERLNKIDGHISKLVWLILAALITGVMGFILSGGLSGV